MAETAATVSPRAASEEPLADNASLPELDGEEDRLESLQARLRAFYWAHDPRKVDRVEEILAKHQGKEEQFLQQVHREFGVRDFGGEEAIDDIYEHQRYSYLSFSWGSSYPGHLLPTDRHQWSGLHGSPSSQTRSKVEPQLPVNWEWTSDWVVDKSSSKCDADGWVYALDFTMINYLIKKGEERSEPNATDYVRRRRWVRTRRRVHSVVPPIELMSAGSDKSDVDGNSDNGGNNAVDWVLEGYQELTSPEKISGTGESQENADPEESSQPAEILQPASPTSPKRPPTPPTRIELAHYSMNMDKSEFDAAWKSTVKDLEQVYARAKEQRAKKKQKWGVKKEKLKRQIHLLEKTIISMQAVAVEEEKKRQNERLKFPGSPRYSKRASMPSPTSRSTPTAASMDSPTNAINLASRMHCAQSKLDALRRYYWHPRENGYSLRFSIDGIFYGLRDFFVESFDSSFSIQISHQTNGAQGITPTCRVTMKGHTVCCGKHVKVVGEKGTRIPKSIWDSMYMDSDFEASINLIYVEDIDDPSSVSQGRWEFLFSPEATYVELINFTRRVKGGMDLPEPMVRKLCSDVLTSLIRDLTLLYFPYELALAFNLPPAKLDIKGEIKIAGQPIDAVMEKELEALDLDAVREEQAKQKLRRQTAEAAEEDSLLPLTPILDAAAAAAQMFSSLLTGSNKEMLAIAELLELSPPQFNLLIALKTSGLFPSTHNFQTLASICAYYNAFSLDEETIETNEEPHTKSQDERLRSVWKRVLELVYIKKTQAARVSPKARSRQKMPSVEISSTEAQSAFELFDIDKFFDAIKRLTKKPASVQVAVNHFYSTLNAMNVVEALSKLYERIVLGIDYSKPRTGADGFIYGIRLGRKATVHPAMAVAAASAAAAAAANSDGEIHPVGTPPVLDLRRYRPTEVSFRTRVQTFSKFWQTLKKVIEFVRENVDDVSAELAGSVKGTGNDCVLNGSFKDADYRGPLSIGLRVPPCFLGFYRAEVIPLGNDRVGMQLDAMLPSVSAKTTTGDEKPQTIKPLEPVGRVMLADLSSEVLLDLDALVAREEERREQALLAAKKKSQATPGSPKQSGAAVPKKSNQHCALSFSFGPSSSNEESDDDSAMVNDKPPSRALGQLNVSTSEFTKLHTTAKAGSFMLRVLSVIDYLLTQYVRPQLLKAFPQHQVLFDTAKAAVMELLQSPKLEVDFDIMARAFIHEDESLMVTLCGSPLHPSPMTFKDEVNLFDVILQVDDLVNIWIDDRYPPYSNPLYF